MRPARNPKKTPLQVRSSKSPTSLIDHIPSLVPETFRHPSTPRHPKQHRSFRSVHQHHAAPCGTMLILVQRSALQCKRQMLCDFGCFCSENPAGKNENRKARAHQESASRRPCQISPNKAPTFDMARLL